MKSFFKQAGIVFLTVLSFQTPVRAETLTEALISAYRSSGLLEQNRAVLRAADEDVAQAVSALRPAVSYFASVNWVDPAPFGADDLSANLGLSAELTVYDFGRTRFAIDATKETVLATREALVSVEQQVLLRAVVAFMSMRREAEFVQLAQNNVRLITEQLEAARDRFEVGEVTRTDVALAEARLASSRAGLAAAQGALAQAREEYNAAIGHYPDQLAPPPALPHIASSVDAAIGIAQSSHPEIRQAQHNVRVAELSILRASANRMPSVTTSGTLSVDQDGNHSASVGLNVGGVLYQGGQLRSLERQAAARRDAARASLHLTTQAVIQETGNAWSSILVAQAAIEASERQIRAARVAFEGTQEEATLGARTTLDVLDAEQELLDAQANQVSAGAERQIASYRLLAAMGQLTARHLGLGITIYDPMDYYNAVRSAPTGRISEEGQRLDAVLEALGHN